MTPFQSLIQGSLQQVQATVILVLLVLVPVPIVLVLTLKMHVEMYSLRWLKQNSLYSVSDVSIDAFVINEDDCSVSDAVPTSSTDPPQLECAVVRTDFNLPNVETIDVIRQGGAYYQVHQLSRIHGQPISLYNDSFLMESMVSTLLETQQSHS